MDDNIMKIVATQAAQAEVLNGIDAKLERCVNALEGSAEHPGMVVRVDRLEQSESRRSRVVWLLVGGFATLSLNALASLIGWK